MAASLLFIACFQQLGGAQTAPSAIWVQYEADGLPHVRAIVASGACPMLTVGTTSTPLSVRAAPSAGFPDTVCDLVLPARATGARVGSFVLPAIPRDPTTIVAFGDTGCRRKEADVQACDDPSAWPFPAVVRDIAGVHPDLVIHVGDYYYRETPCPVTVNCSDSPHGDIAASWAADYFTPMAPLFAVAPIVNVRGNHEDCTRGPLGWPRYLSGLAVVQCLPHEPVAFVAFDNLLLGNVDDATEVTETLPNPPVFTADEALVEARAVTARRETWLLVHRPPVAYEAAHEDTATAGKDIGLLLSGHIHTFAAYTPPGEPPQVLVGIGGDTLAPDDQIAPLAFFDGVVDRRFGYAVFERKGFGWDIVVHDIDTTVHRRCRLEEQAVHCGPALTGP